MILACLLAVVGLVLTPSRPRIRVWPTEGGSRWPIRAGPRPGSAHPGGADPMDTAADVDLFAACLDAGLGTRDAARVVTRVAAPGHRERWSQAVALLSIGVGPERAFAAMADVEGLGELADLVSVSHRSGSALATACRRISEELRARAADHRTAAAERAGVFIALPLAVCFLPAFMIIGLAPVVLGMGSQLLNF